MDRLIKRAEWINTRLSDYLIRGNVNANSLPNQDNRFPAQGLVTPGQKTAGTPGERKGCAVSVDNLSVTFHPPETLFIHEVERFQDSVIEMISDVLSGDPEDWIPLKHGYQGYRKTVLGPGGVRLHSDFPGAAHFNVSFPGQACQRAGAEHLKDFLAYSAENGGKARRIDLALDDYDKLITPEELEAQFHSPNAVTHIRKMKGVKDSERGHPEEGGATRYLGAPSSARRLRCYDKNVESGGLIDAYRWELQERKRAAEKAHHDLLHGDWGEVMRERLVSLIDIKVYESAVEIKDRIRWEPFEELMQGARKAPVYFPVEPKTVEELEEYFRVHQGPSLAILLEHHGGDLNALIEIAKDGKRRWKPKHKKMLEMLERSNDV